MYFQIEEGGREYLTDMLCKELDLFTDFQGEKKEKVQVFLFLLLEIWPEQVFMTP